VAVNPKFMEIEYPFEYGGFYSLKKGTYRISASPNREEKSIKIIIALAPEETTLDSLNTIANPAAIIFSGQCTSKSSGSILSIGKEVQELLITETDSNFTFSLPEDSCLVFFTQHLPHEFSLTLNHTDYGIQEPLVYKEFRAAHAHDEAVSSVGVEIEGELDPEAFTYFINGVIHTFGNDLYRYKGIVAIKGESEKIVLQGVHMLFEMQPGVLWKKDESRKNAIIFIGKNLDRNLLTQGFISCLVQK